MIAVGYRSLTDTRMMPLAESWDDLVAALSEHREVAAKLAGAMWSPVVPAADGPQKRCNAAVAAVAALVLDVDDGMPLDALAEGIEGEWIAYSTWNSTPDAPRYHVVMRLPAAIAAGDWRAFYERANGHRADWLPAVSHAYFLPSHAPGAAWFLQRGGLAA